MARGRGRGGGRGRARGGGGGGEQQGRRQEKVKNKKQKEKAPKPVKDADGSGKKATSADVRYKSTHRTLVLGDGDFSFSKGLVEHVGGKAQQLVASSYDTFTDVTRKYKESRKNIAAVKKGHARVVHGVDAGNLHNHFPKQREYFHRVIFNFPHTGEQRVHLNKELMRRFLFSAPYILHPNGQIHVTIKMRSAP